MSELKDKFLNEYTENLIKDIPIPSEIAEDYYIHSCLTEKSGKITYLLKGKKDGFKYILKCFSPDCKENLAYEYDLLSSLSHNGLPKTVRFLTFDGWSFLVREYFDGITLNELVEKEDTLPVDMSVKIALELCDILKFMHTQNPPVIHRDIKPDNIVYTPDGHCKLIDLGISRRFKKDEAKDTVFMGTLATAAPEQFGYMQTDVRTDIYSMGVLLRYLLTGKLKVKNLNLYVIPKSLKKVILKCVSFSPDDRYPSIKQLKNKLQRFANRPRISKRIGILACACLLLAGIFMIGSGLKSHSTPASSDKVNFTSPLIEKAVRITLGKADNDIITYKDLDDVRQILICGDTVYSRWDEHWMCGNENYLNNKICKTKGNITSLKDISMMHNIEELGIFNEQISDLSPLVGLKLKRLGLGSNSIRDISKISCLNEIETLDIADNSVSDIKPLKKLKNLREIDISYTSVNDISSLEGHDINDISMIETSVQNYQTLTTFPALERFRVRYLNTQGLYTISKIKTLSDLAIYNSNISDLKNFSGLINLENLDLTGNKVISLDGVQGLIKLNHIGLGQNHLRDISALYGLGSLRSIDITDGDMTDYSQLKFLKSLQTVYCNRVQMNEIRSKLKNPAFELQIQ